MGRRLEKNINISVEKCNAQGFGVIKYLSAHIIWLKSVSEAQHVKGLATKALDVVVEVIYKSRHRLAINFPPAKHVSLHLLTTCMSYLLSVLIEINKSLFG